jgi:ubiquinone/menaquinone biosynthesis C-methylase UbiE
MAALSSMRRFSADKHKLGLWDTRVATPRNPLLRALASYISYKRRGVDELARSTPADVVLDAGCGIGAYSQWYCSRRPVATCISLDWSEEALRRAPPSGIGRILRVCGDVRFLPIKSACVEALFSIDTLGHIDNCASALDEFSRVCKNGATLFLHSECRDYQKRWPDKALIKRLGEDVLARYDGHEFIKMADDLYVQYSRRFHVTSFFNPAGYLGFLLGYPDKYRMAFKAAGWQVPLLATIVFAFLKKTPLVGVALRLVNAFTNHCEVYFGLKGGGSCFAMMKKL